jgi:hypothetical protein
MESQNRPADYELSFIGSSLIVEWGGGGLMRDGLILICSSHLMSLRDADVSW